MHVLSLQVPPFFNPSALSETNFGRAGDTKTRAAAENCSFPRFPRIGATNASQGRYCPRINCRSSFPLRFIAVSDPASLQVVWRQFDKNSVSRQDADIVLPHFTRYVREHTLLIVSDRNFNAKHGIGQGFDYDALNLDARFFYVRLVLNRLGSRTRRSGRASASGARSSASPALGPSSAGTRRSSWSSRWWHSVSVRVLIRKRPLPVRRAGQIAQEPWLMRR